MRVAVSYLSSKYKEKETISLIEESNADYIHVDLMDGKFVANKNFTVASITKLLNNTKKKLDVHLMTLTPDKYFESLAMLNTEYITFHIEAVKNVENTIAKINMLGLKAGIAINPETDLKELTKYLSLVDQVLIMSVHPGKGGQAFIPEVIIKIDELVKLREENDLKYIISIDGGINAESINQLKDKELDMIVSGSYICHSDNFNKQIDTLRRA